MQFDGIFWPPHKGIQDGEYKLKRTQDALLVLESPHLKMKNIIHIAGTNGKGSLSAFLQNVLLHNNFTCGVYTSPHLVKVNERIKINGQNISDDELLQYTKEVYFSLKKANLHESLTFFEGMTVLAFYIFAKKNVDFNIIEVGLGGRWDATNVIQNPILSIITSISLDHQDYLGDTIEKIATEKFEIIKKNSDAILGFNPEILHKIFVEKCQSVGTNGKICTEIEKFDNHFDGTYQAQNGSLALQAVQIIENKLNIKLQNAKNIISSSQWKGRMETVHISNIEQDILVDCAHNIGGISSFVGYISKQSGKKYLIFGMLKRKDRSKIIPLLQSTLIENKIDKIICTNFEGEECVPSDILANEINHHACVYVKNLDDAFVLSQGKNIFACGSIYMIGEILNKNSTKN